MDLNWKQVYQKLEKINYYFILLLNIKLHIMKNYLSLTVLVSFIFLVSSCSNDPVDIAEEYVELDKERLELQLELIDLQKIFSK